MYPGSTSSGGLLPDLTRPDPSMGKLRRASSCQEMSTRRTLLFRSSGFVASASDCFQLIIFCKQVVAVKEEKDHRGSYITRVFSAEVPVLRALGVSLLYGQTKPALPKSYGLCFVTTGTS